MKTILNFSIAAMLLMSIACKKAPDSVLLTTDKATMKAGETVTFTFEVDGKAKYILLSESDSLNNFRQGGGLRLYGQTGTLPSTIDKAGTYKFFVDAYNCNIARTDCESTKSNEVTVTVTP